jgi:hypothetical protein
VFYTFFAEVTLLELLSYPSRLQTIQQPLRLLQIERVEAFRKPAVNRSEQFASLLRLALVTPEAREAHGGAEFPGFCLLLARDSERMPQISMRRLANSMKLGPPLAKQ